MNLSIPEATIELGVSETRLRKTLAETAIPTAIELRKTRTGVRKTTVLSPETIALLRSYFEAPLVGAPVPSLAAEDEEPDAFAEEGWGGCGQSPAGPAEPQPARCFAPVALEDPHDLAAEASMPTTSGQTVPLAQFHALLYQHNVLREELGRVSEYLEGCDRLLGEMVRTIATLEERTRQLEPRRSPLRAGNPLTGALRSVSASVQNALFARPPATSLRAPSEVFYANMLTGR